jgi:hypothetical protein
MHEQKRDRLTVVGRDPNYHYRIVNDVDDRIERLKIAGYEIAEEKVGIGDPGVENSNISLGSGARMHVGKGVKAVLMKIPKELFQEDQKAKQREIDAKEAAIKRKANSGEGGTYGEVTVKRGQPD